MGSGYLQSQMNLGEDDEIMDDSNIDIEEELIHLNNFDNERQLLLLRREIGHIVAHGLNPNEGWYDDRFEHINLYSRLNWSGLAKKFHNKDDFIHDTSIYILRLSDELLEERSTKPNFHINTYYRFIMAIYNVWEYYKNIYAANEDDDMMQLIEGIKFL
jgi:hypothetical protein